MSDSNRLRGDPPSAKADATSVNAPGERERLMTELAIAYNGRHYQYDTYRYDHLADAVNYARLQASRHLDGDAEIRSMPPPEYVEMPNESQRELMTVLEITFADGVYQLGSFRYDRLVDAVNYARRLRRLS